MPLSSAYSRFIFVLAMILMLPMLSQSMDNGAVEVRKFDDTTLKEISSNDNFFYLEKEKSDPGTIYALTDWIKKMLLFVFGNRIAMAVFSNFHLIILFIALILIILKMSHLSPSRIFYKVRKSVPGRFSIDEASIDTVDFAELIANALKQKNFRLALRYHYLEILKILSENEMIEWTPHKTNYEIMNELRGKPFSDGFRSLALIFEYVWYGEFKISENGFSEVQDDFQKLKKQII